MLHHIRLRLILGLTVLIILNVICFGLLNPLDSAAIVIFLAFGILALDVFALLYIVIKLLQRLFGRPKRSAVQLAGIFTGVIVVLLALQSVGQLGVKDVVAVLLVCVITYFYLSRYHK